MPRRLLALALFAAAASLEACSYSPAYGGAACAKAPPWCPDGFVCSAGRCLPASFFDAQDGGADDGPADAGDATADAGPGDDGFVDGGDPQEADGGDGEPDGADQGQNDSDQGQNDSDPCGGCSAGYFCNESSHTCHPCDSEEHCGTSCQPCLQGESCQKLGESFCCRGECASASVCRSIACGAGAWICSLFFGPERLEWREKQTGGTYYCTLAEPSSPGASVPIETTFQCDSDSQKLRFFCTYDGTCQEGQCKPNPQVVRRHDCGGLFGCNPATGRCRRHFKEGANCKFNFDCESFCCSRESNSVCVAAADRMNCKIDTTEFESDYTYYTWVAYNQSDPHNISLWYSRRDHNGDPCVNDYDCDSGLCWGYPRKHCRFSSCLPGDEDADIRQYYFCRAGVGDKTTADYLPTVTNSDPLPLDDDCPDSN